MNPSDSITAVSKRFGPLPDRRQLLLERLFENHPHLRERAAEWAQRDECLDEFCANCLRQIQNLARKTIAIVYRSDLWSGLGDDFPDMLEKAGYNCLLLAFSPGFDKREDLYPADIALFRRLDFIDACLGTWLPLGVTWGDGWLRDLKVIDVNRMASQFLNSSGGSPSLHLMKFGEYVVRPFRATSPQTDSAREIKQPENVKIPRNAIGPRRETFLIPLFPRKYERVRAIREKLAPEEIDRILFCPTRSDIPDYCVKAHGHTIISELLRRFPKHKIAFRPRPEDREKPEVITIVKAFEERNRFIYNDVDDYADNYARGVLLITDNSSTGQTFTVATSQPSIYLPAAGVDMCLSIKELDGVGCFKANSLAELFDKAENFVHSQQDRWDAIKEVTRTVYDGNKSFSSEFMTYLATILKGEVHKNWFRVSLAPENIVGDDPADYETSICSMFASGGGGFSCCRDFSLLQRYLAALRGANRPASPSVFEQVLPAYTHYQKVGHAIYSQIRPVLQLASHNLKLKAHSQETSQCLRRCVEAIELRNHEPSLRKFLEDVTNAPPLWQWLLQEAHSNNPKSGNIGRCVKSDITNNAELAMRRLLFIRLKALCMEDVHQVALFGAGQHTRWIQRHARIPWGMRVGWVLDDTPNAAVDVSPLTPQLPEDVSVSAIDAVLLSTDCMQSLLKQRCEQLWGKGEVMIVDLYEHLPPGPYVDQWTNHDLLQAIHRELLISTLQCAHREQNVRSVAILSHRPINQIYDLNELEKRSGVRVQLVIDPQTSTDSVVPLESSNMTNIDAIVLATPSVPINERTMCRNFLPTSPPLIDPFESSAPF